jgi:hypothetical protein
MTDQEIANTLEGWLHLYSQTSRTGAGYRMTGPQFVSNVRELITEIRQEERPTIAMR